MRCVKSHNRYLLPCPPRPSRSTLPTQVDARGGDPLRAFPNADRTAFATLSRHHLDVANVSKQSGHDRQPLLIRSCRKSVTRGQEDRIQVASQAHFSSKGLLASRLKYLQQNLVGQVHEVARLGISPTGRASLYTGNRTGDKYLHHLLVHRNLAKGQEAGQLGSFSSSY